MCLPSPKIPDMSAQIKAQQHALKAEREAKLQGPTRNSANLYIGSKGVQSRPDSSFTNNQFRYFNGNLSNINIWSRAYSDTQIKNISESLNGSPYIGNIFYQHGFATITHPKYLTILGGAGTGEMAVGEDFIVEADENYQINPF